MNHFVRHMVDKDCIDTEFQCTAEADAPCRTACQCVVRTDYNEVCLCENPVLVDLGYCNPLEYLQDAPDEVFAGKRQSARTGWSPITLQWEGDYYTWDYDDGETAENKPSRCEHGGDPAKCTVGYDES